MAPPKRLPFPEAVTPAPSVSAEPVAFVATKLVGSVVSVPAFPKVFHSTSEAAFALWLSPATAEKHIGVS